MSITLAETALGLLAVRMVWRLVARRTRCHWPLAWPLAAWIVATAVAALASARPLESLLAARNVFLVLSVWVVLDAVPGVVGARRALLALLAVLGAVAVVGILQVTYCAELQPWAPILGRVATKCHRAHGFYSIYMTLGGVLNVVCRAPAPSLLPLREAPRWAPAAWLLGAAGLAVTYVRGAWVGFVAGLVIVAASLRRRRPAAFGVLVALGVLMLLLPGVRGRARSIVDPRDPTSSERVLMWKSGLAMARDHWLTGVGPGQVKRVYPDYAAAEVTNKSRGHLHSTPIQLLVERGLPGLVAWLALFAAFVGRAVGIARTAGTDPRGRALAVGGIAAVGGFLVAGLTEYNFGDSEVLLATTFVMALALAAGRRGPADDLLRYAGCDREETAP